MSARNVALEYPEGLQTESNANLTLTLAAAGRHARRAHRRTGRLVSRTAPRLQPGAFRLAPGHRPRRRPRQPFLSRLRLDLSVASVEDVRIDNNYGRLDLSAGLRIVGHRSSGQA